MKLTPERTRQLLADSEAILEGHFVGTSGKHLSTYIAKNRATRFTSVISELCEGIAERFASDDIDAVVAPAVGGIALSQWTAYHLSRLRTDRPEVLALYAERDERVVDKREGEGGLYLVTTHFRSGERRTTDALYDGDEVVIRQSKFVLKRDFDKDVRGKRVLEVEDTLTTGGSAARTAQAIVACGGILIGLGVLANGGKVTAADIGTNWLEALMTVEQQIFTEEECADHGLCAKGVPINPSPGHGAAFLLRKGKVHIP